MESVGSGSWASCRMPSRMAFTASRCSQVPNFDRPSKRSSRRHAFTKTSWVISSAKARLAHIRTASACTRPT